VYIQYIQKNNNYNKPLTIGAFRYTQICIKLTIFLAMEVHQLNIKADFIFMVNCVGCIS